MVRSLLSLVQGLYVYSSTRYPRSYYATSSLSSRRRVYETIFVLLPGTRYISLDRLYRHSKYDVTAINALQAQKENLKKNKNKLHFNSLILLNREACKLPFLSRTKFFEFPF